MTEVGVDIMRSRVIKFRLSGVHEDRHQAFEAPEGEVENKGKLEAHQQGQCARRVQRAPAACHDNVRLKRCSGIQCRENGWRDPRGDGVGRERLD